MAQRAFVRYTKKGHIVPGSLIVTTKGGYPKDGTYKEVIVDQCCANQALRYDTDTGNSNDVVFMGIPTPFPWTSGYLYMGLGCAAMSMDTEWSYIYIPGEPATIQELVDILNVRAAYLGTFEVSHDGVTLILNINPEAASSMCRGPLTDTIVFYIVDGGGL